MKEITAETKLYADAFVKFVENTKKVDGLVQEMSETAGAITKLSTAMKSDLLADQQRLETESDTTIQDTERQVMALGVGGFIVGAILALLLGRSIAGPMIAMCAAMRKLAAGDFEVVLPGLGRRDELGDMASAVEEFKVQAIAKAGELELSVANLGDPIPPEAIDRLFQPFYRVSAQDAAEGLGLGLYIASEIARAHGGKIEVASSAQEIRFTFRMPLR